MKWLEFTCLTPKKIQELSDGLAAEPLEVYKNRYLVPSSELSSLARADNLRYIAEIIDLFDGESSLLVFGSGHSNNCNTYLSECDNIINVVAVDFVEEAGIGLLPDISFYNTNILENTLPAQCDYVLTTHTVEHFTRSDVLGVVVPRLLEAARKAVVIVVPYGEYWSEEPSHCCLFYENDELCWLSSKYKIIFEGRELVLWIDK